MTDLMTDLMSGAAITGTTQHVRVVIADDQMLQREGIAMLLQRDPCVEVVGRGSNGQEAIDLAAELQPDVLLVDIRMPMVTAFRSCARSRLAGQRCASSF